MGFSTCFANPDSTAASVFSNYVMEQLDQNTKISTDVYSRISDEDICNYEKTILRYDDNHNLIEDNICERDVYDEIKKTVENLISKVDKSNDLEKASAIYKWVAENIRYDYDSEKFSVMATQDAFCTFKYRKAVCAGYSCLLQMMMKTADIPCGYVSSIANSKTNSQKKELNVDIKNNGENKTSHAFNVVYLKDGTEQRTGWALIDSTWASNGLCQLNGQNNANKILETFFPALNKKTSFKSANCSIMNMTDHQIKCVKCDSNKLDYSVNFGYDKIWMTSDGLNLKLMYIPAGPKIFDIESDSESEDSEDINKLKTKYVITISKELSKFKVPVFFFDNLQAFKYAQEVIIEGDVEIDFNESNKHILDEIRDKLNFKKSNKYKFDEKDKNKVLDKVTGKEVFDFSKK